MNSRPILVAAIVASFALGAVGGYAVRRPTGQSRSEWIPLNASTPKEGGFDQRLINYGFADAVVFADLPLPIVSTLEGRAKLIPAVSGADLTRNLAYEVSFTLSEVPVEKRPEKYKKEHTSPEGMTILAPDHIWYQVYFTFFLKDADGFILREITSPLVSASSGRQNNYQFIIQEAVLQSLSERVRSVGVGLTFAKCTTCEAS